MGCGSREAKATPDRLTMASFLTAIVINMVYGGVASIGALYEGKCGLRRTLAPIIARAHYVDIMRSMALLPSRARAHAPFPTEAALRGTVSMFNNIMQPFICRRGCIYTVDDDQARFRGNYRGMVKVLSARKSDGLLLHAFSSASTCVTALLEPETEVKHATAALCALADTATARGREGAPGAMLIAADRGYSQPQQVADGIISQSGASYLGTCQSFNPRLRSGAPFRFVDASQAVRSSHRFLPGRMVAMASGGAFFEVPEEKRIAAQYTVVTKAGKDRYLYATAIMQNKRHLSTAGHNMLDCDNTQARARPLSALYVLEPVPAAWKRPHSPHSRGNLAVFLSLCGTVTQLTTEQGTPDWHALRRFALLQQHLLQGGGARRAVPATRRQRRRVQGGGSPRASGSPTFLGLVPAASSHCGCVRWPSERARRAGKPDCAAGRHVWNPHTARHARPPAACTTGSAVGGDVAGRRAVTAVRVPDLGQQVQAGGGGQGRSVGRC